MCYGLYYFVNVYNFVILRHCSIFLTLYCLKKIDVCSSSSSQSNLCANYLLLIVICLFKFTLLTHTKIKKKVNRNRWAYFKADMSLKWTRRVNYLPDPQPSAPWGASCWFLIQRSKVEKILRCYIYCIIFFCSLSLSNSYNGHWNHLSQQRTNSKYYYVRGVKPDFEPLT